MAMTNFRAQDMRPLAPKAEKPAKALDATPDLIAAVSEPVAKPSKKAKKIEDPVAAEVTPEEAPVEDEA